MRTKEEILADYGNVNVRKLIFEILLDIRSLLEEISEN
jgi:hypothetical protein